MANHYIKINENDEIIDGFCDAFREPDQDCILVKENTRDHFNPRITDSNDLYINKFIDGVIVEISEDERGTIDERAEIEYKRKTAERKKRYIITDDSLIDKIYELLDNDQPLNKETLAEEIAERKKVKTDIPLT